MRKVENSRMVSLNFKFDAAHMLDDGIYRNIHGHTYSGFVAIEGPIDITTGVVVDFDAIREIINRLDHSFILSGELKGAELELSMILSDNQMKSATLENCKYTTCENISLFIAETIYKELFNNDPAYSIELTLKESEDSSVTVAIGGEEL